MRLTERNMNSAPRMYEENDISGQAAIPEGFSLRNQHRGQIELTIKWQAFFS